MEARQIVIGQCEISIPDYFQQVDSIPGDPEGSISLMAQSDNAVCLVMLQPVSAEDAMPFDDPQIVIDGIHECMSEDQGLLEVETGGDKGNRYIYSIVKTLKNAEVSGGIQYTLTLDKECGDGIIQAQGFFDEIGITGLRDTKVFHFYSTMDGWDQTRTDWTRDPYDADYKHGKLMNKSEFREFDLLFPAHPLSMAREFALTVSTDGKIIEENQVAESALAKLEDEYLFDLEKENVSPSAIELIDKTPSDLEPLDMAWCLLTAVASTFISTNEDFAKWLEGIHDAASDKSDSFDAVQKILDQTLHHKGDWMDNFKARDAQNAYGLFHRLLGGHDIFATGESLTPHNPFMMMIKQEGSVAGGVLQATKHLIADTFSSQGLPLPFSSYLDYAKDNGRPWNRIIDIVQELSISTTGNKDQAEAIYSHMFTLRAQDYIGGGAALVLTTAYLKARQIEDEIRAVQIRLVSYALSFFAQAAVGAAKQNGVPYINHVVGAAMAKNLVQLFYFSNKRTNLLDAKTSQLHEEVVEVITEHDDLKDLL